MTETRNVAWLGSVRRAQEADLPAMAAQAAELVRMHHALDPLRFFLPPDVESGYRGWFGRELAEPKAVLLVAALDGRVVGYAYGRVEERDWNMLLDRHAALHDLHVLPDVRGSGAAEALLEAFVAEARDQQAPRVVLSSAAKNRRAQAFFTKHGFRPTMVEMTRET